MSAVGGMQYDEQGRPYFLTSDGKRSYVSPVAMGDKAPEDKTGIFRQAPQWDQDKGKFETPIDWGNIMSMVTAGVLSAGAASALMSGAAPTALGSTAASTAAPTAAGGGLASTTIGSGYIPAITGGSGMGAGAGTGSSILGMLGKGSDVANRLATVLGGASRDMNATNALNDRNRVSEWEAGENASLNRDKFATTAPATRLNTSYMASLMNNYTPTTIKWNGPGSGLKGEQPIYEGGFKGAMANLDPETRSLSSQVMKDMLASQMEGGTTGGRKDTYMNPQPEIGKESGGSKALGTGALITSILGALGKKKTSGVSPLLNWGNT